MDSEKAHVKPSYNDLRNQINVQFQSKIQEYTSFLISISPYIGVQKYLNENSYSYEIIDIIINTLANVNLNSAYIYM